MGQYFLVLNLDKLQYLHPHCFGDGLKLLEFGCSSNGTLTGLTFLLRKSTEGGGGDYDGSHEIVGSWAGDRIAIVGDYDDSKLYQEAGESWHNISHYVLDAMKEDEYLKRASEESQHSGFSYLGGPDEHNTDSHAGEPRPPYGTPPKEDIRPVLRDRLFNSERR